MSDRAKWLRRETLELSLANGGYHFGGCFSIIEIMIALFDFVMKPEDTFILSKGHACWPWYVLLRERGLNPKLEGHPSRDPANGIPCTTGSEGHGLPMALGMGLARKMKKAPGRIYVLMGDGECQEGTTWESLLTGAHRAIDNVTAIIDMNSIQGSGFVKDILPVWSIEALAKQLNWCVRSVYGHGVEDITSALGHSCAAPCMVIAETIKGKGVSFMEGKPEWHAKFPNADQLKQIRKELA